MSYLTDLYIIFTLKMESVSKNTIFGLKMVKNGIFRYRFHFKGKNDVWISQVRRVKGAFNNYVDQILTIFDPLPPRVDKRGYQNIKYQNVTHFNQHSNT